MNNEIKMLVDVKDAQKRILNCMTTDEVKKFIENSVFSDDPKYTAAITYGMCIASMLLVDCDSNPIVSDDKDKPKIAGEPNPVGIYLITQVEFDNMENEIHSAIRRTPVGVVNGTIYDVRDKIAELTYNASEYKYRGWDKQEYPYFETTELNIL